jgi:16S rRNA (uracil1498-N3)-methyltransferase
MIRIFLPPVKLSSKHITITGDQAKHLSLVLRVKPEDPVTIFDGTGHKYDCRILQCHKKEVVVECVSKEPYSAESPLSITLAQGLPKGDKMDFIIQKSTELGVSNIIPLITDHAQVRHTHRIERWHKIALSASQQSGRDKVPDIHSPVDFKDFLSSIPLEKSKSRTGDGERKFPGIIFSEEQKERNFGKVLSGLKDLRHIDLMVGPEGGFSKGEVYAAVAKGYREVSLGARVLRTETAPLAAISIIQYELGDMG